VTESATATARETVVGIGIGIGIGIEKGTVTEIGTVNATVIAIEIIEIGGELVATSASLAH